MYKGGLDRVMAGKDRRLRNLKDIIERIGKIMEDMTKTMPLIFERDRELSIDKQAIEKIKYLMHFKNAGPANVGFGGVINDIVNKALQEFFIFEFKELKIEHYTDPLYEQRKEAIKRKFEEGNQIRENARLVEIAKKNILKKEIERLKVKEKKTGKKITMEEEYPPVKVKMEGMTTYQGEILNPGDKITIPGDVAKRWERVKLARIIKT